MLISIVIDINKHCNKYMSIENWLHFVTDSAGAELTDYQMFAIILAIVTVCFTTIIILLVGVFCCILKKSLAKPTGKYLFDENAIWLLFVMYKWYLIFRELLLNGYFALDSFEYFYCNLTNLIVIFYCNN